MPERKRREMMDHPFPKSTSTVEKIKRLWHAVSPTDILGILIDADPDSMASALALRRLLWRKVKHVWIYRINRIKRADNIAFIRLLEVEQQHIRYIKRSRITRWAIVDSQPQSRKEFMNHQFDFDIIIDHHPLLTTSKASFVDIRENYGAASTIMTEYLRAAKIIPSSRLATALFYGIKTDTANFVRESLPNDINAFRYLYNFINMSIIKKIESSEMTKKTLSKIQLAIKKLILLDHIAFVHMGKIDDPDVLVIIADFLLRLAEASWSVVSAVYDQKLVVILRNATFSADAGTTAQRLFGQRAVSAGGHKGAARAEIPLSNIPSEIKEQSEISNFVREHIKDIKG